MPYKKFTIFIPFIILTSCISKSPSKKKNYPDNDGGLYSLNGNVKQITIELAKGQYTPNPGQDYDIAFFNKRGDVYKMINGFHGMVSQTHYVTIYDKNRNKLETLGYFRPSDLHVMGNPRPPLPIGKTSQSKVDIQLEEIYRYNNHNQAINYVVDPNKTADSSTYQYNENGQLIELDHYTYSKKLMDVTKFKYDDNDNLIESNQYHWNRLMVKINYAYIKFDSNNNWTDEKVHFEGYLGFNDIRNYKMHREIIYY